MCGKKTIKKEIEKTIKVEVDESLHEKVDESLHEKVDESVHEKVKIENIKMKNVSDEEELSDDAIFECLKNDLLVGTNSTYKNLLELQDDVWETKIESFCTQISRDEKELDKHYEKPFDEIFPPVARSVKK